MSIKCKKCGAGSCMKNGMVRGKQRFKCKSCRVNFVIGDEREKVTPDGKALAALLYGDDKTSYEFIAKLFNVSRVAVMKWISKTGPRQSIHSNRTQVEQMQTDQVCQFINKENEKIGGQGNWIVATTRPSNDLLSIVLLKSMKEEINK